MAPFVDDAGVREAVKTFEVTSSALNDPTKLTKLMFFASKAFPKGSNAAIGAVTQIIQCLKYCLVFKNVASDSVYSKEFLVGGARKAGFAHVFFKRMAFVSFIEVLVRSSQGPAAEEAKSMVLPRLAKFTDFQAFAARTSAAAFGAGLEAGTVTEVSDDEGTGAETGMLNAAEAKLAEFKQGLGKSGKLLVEFLSKIHGGSFDEEFDQMATAELASTAFTFPMSCLLYTSPSPRD